jgi:hypothetical protein
MSAFSVGTSAFGSEVAKQKADDVAVRANATAAQKGQIQDALAPSREDALSTILKWVPGEVIGAYAAVVAALIATSDGRAGRATGREGWLLAVFMVGALLMTTLGGYNAYRKVKADGKLPSGKGIDLLVRGALSAVGLLLWSCVIPGTVTNKSGLLTTYEGAASAMVFFVAIIFGLFAEFLVLPVTLKRIAKGLG